MIQKTFRTLLAPLIAVAAFCACERQIDFDYPPADMSVVFDGQISNEGVDVRISHTRPIGTKGKGEPVGDAQVWIADDEGKEEQLVYDDSRGCFTSATGLVGIPGHTYQMRAIVDGRQFEATSTMQGAAVVDTVYFRWIKAMSVKLYFYYVKGRDPRVNERQYALCRLMRGDELFRWTYRSGRGNVNGIFEYDIVCSTQKEMDDGIDEDGKIPLMEGDSISLELLTFDRPAWEFYQSLSSSERTTANPVTNIKGGEQGIFMPANITRPGTIVFNKEKAFNER